MARGPLTLYSHHNCLLLGPGLAPDHASEVTCDMYKRGQHCMLARRYPPKGPVDYAMLPGAASVASQHGICLPDQRIHAHSYMLIPAVWLYRPTKPVLTALPLEPLLATLPAAPIQKAIMTHTHTTEVSCPPARACLGSTQTGHAGCCLLLRCRCNCCSLKKPAQICCLCQQGPYIL